MHFTGILQGKNLFGEGAYKNNLKKLKRTRNLEKITNVTVAVVMQLSRDWGEFSAFRFQDIRLKKGVHVFIPFIH